MEDVSSILRDKRVVFVGKLGALSRKEAMRLVREHGGNPLERLTGDVDLVIIGADELPAEDISDLLSDSIRVGMREGRTTLVHEHEYGSSWALWTSLRTCSSIRPR